MTTNEKLELAASLSLRDEITQHYYRTTSSRGHQRTREYYELAAALLKRRQERPPPHDISVASISPVAAGRCSIVWKGRE